MAVSIYFLPVPAFFQSYFFNKEVLYEKKQAAAVIPSYSDTAAGSGGDTQQPFSPEPVSFLERGSAGEFLSFITGAKGLKILYDPFFKEIFNPEIAPDRLNSLLSLLLGKKVKVMHVLPTDSSRLGDETSLVIMDIVVQLEDGSIVDVEIQKIGYLFPGQRTACYSADLLLRQYKAARDNSKGKHFSYKSVRDVYTIIFFENSPKVFWDYPERFSHSFQQASDSGLKLDLLQKYIFVPLDIFSKNRQNGIRSDWEAWLLFLSSDNPEDIAMLMDYHPLFREMYGHIYDICRNVERMMNMFSEELRIMDRNTVQLMIDEMQDEIKQKDAAIKQKDADIKQKDADIRQKDADIRQKDADIRQKDADIKQKDADIKRLTEELSAIKRRMGQS